MHLKACDICGSRTEENKTKKKWIDGSRFKKARSNHYTDAQVGDAEGLFKSLKWIYRWIKIQESKTQEAITILMPSLGWGHRRSLQVTMDQDPRSNVYTDAQVGDAEGLFKSLWIIIPQPQVYLSIRHYNLCKKYTV